MRLLIAMEWTLMWYSSSSGHIELRITMEQARSASHSGQCDDDVEALRRVPAIRRQLDRLNAEHVRAELREYGAWDAIELADHDANLNRLLWLACGQIVDEAVFQ